jgi:hypothetical protein
MLEIVLSLVAAVARKFIHKVTTRASARHCPSTLP